MIARLVGIVEARVIDGVTSVVGVAGNDKESEDGVLLMFVLIGGGTEDILSEYMCTKRC